MRLDLQPGVVHDVVLLPRDHWGPRHEAVARVHGRGSGVACAHARGLAAATIEGLAVM